MSNYRLFALVATETLLASSCSDDAVPSPGQMTPIDVSELQGEELDKYAFGCEYFAEDTSIKVETSAPYEYIEFASRAAIEFAQVGNKSTSKSNTSLSTSNLVGVIKVESCGDYPEIDVYFDAEDRKPNNWSSGYVRNKVSWSIGNNVWMRFCVVPAEKFVGIGKDYAVLLLTDEVKGPMYKSYGSYDRQKILRIRLDADDGKPIGDLKYIPGAGINATREFLPNNYDKNNNLTLYLQHFKKEWNSGTLPDLKFEYAVFGSLYGGDEKYEGKARFDTEDKKNSNAFDLLELSYTGLGGYEKLNEVKPSDQKRIGEYNGIVLINKNATFTISKAPSK